MKSNKTEKKFPAPEFPDKPTMEVAWQGVPLTWEVDPDSPKESPMLFDREHCGKCYRVKDGEVYTVRLGVHSDPNGIGTISRDSTAVCVIPTESGKQLHIMALFSVAEIYPAMLMDYVFLCADTAFHLEYVYQSAMLESNNGSKGLLLSDNAVELRDDLVIISHCGLEGEIPGYCTYTYDFITVQVRVVFDEDAAEEEGSKEK